MGFVKDSLKSVWKPDTVFSIMAMYKEYVAEHGTEGTTNAIIGSLCDEEGKLVTYNTVFENEKKFPDVKRAAYAAGMKGNPEFVRAIQNWILDGNSKLYSDAVSTCGGTGAVFITLDMCLDAGQTVIMPEVAWGSYQLMASEFNFETEKYDVYDLNDMFEKIEKVAKKQHKVVIIINSPCHNPCGMSYSDDEWERIVAKLNEVSEYSDVILLNDIAYIDYAQDPKKAREYIQKFDAISEKVMVAIAASTSKSFSYYGQRLGALIILGKKESDVEDFEKAVELKARCTWSNCNNIAMSNSAQVMEELTEDYLKEKKVYIDLLKQRSDLFIKEATEEGLEFYPYKEGFFVTLKYDDESQRDRIHQTLLDNHIYTVKTAKGIRIAICSMPLEAIKGLAKKIKSVY